MVFLQGDKLEPDQLAKNSVTDAWRASGAHRVMDRTWTGTTIFETKVVAEPRVALPPIECIDVHTKSLEEKLADSWNAMNSQATSQLCRQLLPDRLP